MIIQGDSRHLTEGILKISIHSEPRIALGYSANKGRSIYACNRSSRVYPLATYKYALIL